MSAWKEYKLGDVVTFQRGYDLPKTRMAAGKFPVAGSNGVIGHHNEFTTKGPGVTIGRSGNIGTPIFYKTDYWAHNTVLFVKDFKNSDPKFIYYFLKKIDFSQFNAGSAVPTLNRNHIHELDVLLPPLPEQLQIASILSSLDDKINLLHRQNKTLEALAETLFRQWFLPASAGQAGVEEVEEGWETGKLGDYADVTTGKGLKRHEFDDNGIYPVLGANGEMGRTNKFLTDDRLILTGRVGTLGKVYISEDKVWISDNVLIVRPVSNFFYPIYFIIKRTEFENMNVGSTQPLVTQTDLKNIEFKLPSADILESYEKQCSTCFEKISKNKGQIRTLTRLRDTLLPKLMGGEVRVREYEKTV